MKKPNRSSKETAAAQKRGAKRRTRLRKTQSEKSARIHHNQKLKLAQEKKFKEHMQNLALERRGM